MSVAVAAIAYNLSLDKRPTIVLCSDTRLSYAHSGSNELGVKLLPVGWGWLAQLAGDPGAARDAIARVSKAFDSITDPTRMSQVLDAIQAGIDDYKESPLFRPDAIELLFSGFVGNSPMLLHLEPSLQLRDPSHHCAIGEGAIAATLMLNYRGRAVGSTTDNAIYCVYEAKRFAESITSIGRTSFLLVQTPTKNISRERVTCAFVGSSGLARLDTYYEQYGPQPIGALDFSPDDIVLPPTVKLAQPTQSRPKRGRKRQPPSRA